MTTSKVILLLFTVPFILCACQSPEVSSRSETIEEVQQTQPLSAAHKMEYEQKYKRATKLLGLYDSGNPYAKDILNAIAQENGADSSTYENGVVYFVSNGQKFSVDMDKWMPYADQWMRALVLEVKRLYQQERHSQKTNKERTVSPVCKTAYAKALLQGAFNSVPAFCWNEDLERALCPAAEKAAILTGNFSVIPTRCVKYLRQ